MTLEEAIQHLKESLADPTHKWDCEECKAEHEQLLKWLEEYKRLKYEMIPAYDEAEIDEVIAEIQRCTDLSTPGFVIRSAETLRDEIAMLKDYKRLKADYADLGNRLRTANTENDELKRMLKNSLEALDAMAENVRDECGDAACGLCEYDSPLNEYGEMIYECEGVNGKTDCFKWRHHDEAMKLLGGAENAEN